MNIDELKKKRKALEESRNDDIRKMDEIITESERISCVAKYSHSILDKIDSEFEKITSLNKVDI